MSTSEIPAAKLLDVRELPCSVKIGLIFERWNALAPGDFFVLWNHREPLHVRTDLETAVPGSFTWEHLAAPEGFQIKISRLKETPPVTKYSECKGHSH